MHVCIVGVQCMIGFLAHTKNRSQLLRCKREYSTSFLLSFVVEVVFFLQVYFAFR